MQISVFWFRRDLRLVDNTALANALAADHPVLPIFIFDQHILSELPKDDARVTFIHQQLAAIQDGLIKTGSGLQVFHGDPIDVWQQILTTYDVQNIFFNQDYEPYALSRDAELLALASRKNIIVHSFKDQVIFEKDEVVKSDGKPYTVFTPYKRQWLHTFELQQPDLRPLTNENNFLRHESNFPSLESIGFKSSDIQVPTFDLAIENTYAEKRDFPSLNGTSHLSTHLRFGTVSIRQIVANLNDMHGTLMSELIWREFFMQILYHFPKVVTENFKVKYNHIQWRNNSEEFDAWCKGETGYPMVDAGMRELNATGLMHNRVRMITAGFLCKHLLIDWRWGEAYFAEKLLDYELSSNNGNWQWAAGTGCDAAPYFRIFNPMEQLKKFDKDGFYIRKWIPEFDSMKYPPEMIEHKFARLRALEKYKQGMRN
jgi:deoxyribodipyrimidine photo-lyase